MRLNITAFFTYYFIKDKTLEVDYFLIFTLCIISLQFLIFVFTKTLSWLYVKNSTLSYRLFVASLYISINSIFLLTIFHIYPMFRIGAFILVILLFSSFSSLLCSVVYLLLKKTKYGIKSYNILTWLYPLSLCSIIGISVYNAYTPVVIHYEIEIDKPLSPLRIGMASDLHLGRLFGCTQLDKLSHIMNKENVDIILLPGDIMDDNIDSYIAENMSSHLSKLKAPLGVYATLGNHDFLGKEQEISQELRKVGIRVLMDNIANINNKFILIGRNDKLFQKRLKTAQLLETVNTNLPIFLLDHRPNEILEHSFLPIDIQVSGHAHKGQIFPGNIITKLLYDLDYGYKKIGKGHFFVTSGYGFWGVPMRLGSQSEVFIIDVKGK